MRLEFLPVGLLVQFGDPDPVIVYRANIMNHRAEGFYRQHGAAHTAPAFEQTPVADADLDRKSVV